MDGSSFRFTQQEASGKAAQSHACCPLSTEIMVCSIRQNNDIKGIVNGETEYKLSFYADDINLFLHNIQCN